MAEAIRKQRQPVRGSFTRAVNELKMLLEAEPVDEDAVEFKVVRLGQFYEKLKVLDEQLLNKMMDDNVSEEEYNQEYSAVEGYENTWCEFNLKVDRLKRKNNSRSPTPSFGTPDGVSTVSSNTRMKKSYKLPKIEIKKFSGEVKDWLSFWSQFQKIHEDEDLHASDKFLYLLQAMVEDSEADTLLRMYQVTEAEYPNAIEALKRNFGDEEVLVDYYVRELINLTIQNSKEKVPVSKVYKQVGAQLQCLESIGVKIEEGERFLCPLILSCLPVEIVTAWHRSRRILTDLPKGETKGRLKKLMEFIRQEVEDERKRTLAEEGNTSSKPEPKETKSRNSKKTDVAKEPKSEYPTAAGLFVGEGKTCIFCDKGHYSELCGAAQNTNLEEKKRSVRRTKACHTCLKRGHQAKDCRAFVKCVICGLKHHTIMCPEAPCNRVQRTEDNFQPYDGEAHVNFNSCGPVLLKTLIVKAEGENGSSITARILMDDGSQGSYITEGAAKKLGLKPKGEVFFKKTVFGNKTSGVQRHRVYTLSLRSITGGRREEITVVDEPSLCGVLPTAPRGPWMDELRKKNIVITDTADHPPEIEVLVGSDYWGRIVTGRHVKLSSGLYAYETTLGWTLSGLVSKPHSDTNTALSVVHSYFDGSRVSDYWDLEPIGIKDPIEVLSKEEKETMVMDHFSNTVKQKEDGRYLVSLPWVLDRSEIPSNRIVAEKRLLSTTNKLKTLGKINSYSEVFKGWEQEGIVRAVKEEDGELAHYLPHRPVFKESETTPVRPVFDASCKVGRSPSLNECLEPGPNLMELIPDVLMKFREKKIGVTSDIRKAFQMIEVSEEDQPFQRFLWWEDNQCQKVKVFQHQRVVFGINVSPFMLHAVLNYHLSQVTGEDAAIAKKFLQSVYVDNSLTSVDNYEEYEEFKEKAVRILANAKMELRQWERTEDTSGVGSSECGLGVVGGGVSHVSSILGLKWNKVEDTIGVDVPNVDSTQKLTKRSVLSSVQRIFDPLGFTCPVTIQPKMILQELWNVKSGWDEEIPENLQLKFRKWLEEVSFLSQIWIPRQVKTSMAEDGIQLHVFVDASQDAYATVVFLRNEVEGQVTVRFIQAKARVSPIKKATIPQLELMACVIGARLSSSIKKSIGIANPRSYFWSDSTTALAWIRRNNGWGTFVGNRVREILQLTSADQWKHVPGENNPADLPSRGCSPRQLLESCWWEGPEWLKKPEDHWPSTVVEEDEESIQSEKKKGKVTLAASIESENFKPPFSSYRKNVAIFGWIRRFISNTRKKKENRNTSPVLSLEEMRGGELDLIKLIQGEQSSSLSKVPVPVITKDGILRVKSQMLNREDLEYFRMPILLPKSHPVVHQLISEAHKTYGHIGTQALLGKLREKYWILQGRKEVKKVIRQCTSCRRHEAKPLDVDPAALPKERVTLESAFQTTGVDLAGPLYLKNGEKRWIVLYTCAVYRCVQLDLVSSLSAEAFVDSLQRFVYTFGRPNTVYSDNGTNFHGAVNLFKEVSWEKVKKISEVKKIEWIFNPPTAAWWGGWWERLVRSVKGILKRMLGNAKLNEDNLRTSLAVVVAAINDRPLTTVTEDHGDLIPLTPAMFIRGPIVRDFPEAGMMSPKDFQEAFKKTTKLQEELKLRFRSEYLAMLINRAKEKKTPEPKVGDIVLIGADNMKRLEWPMGRILELYPGRDGSVRVAKVKTKSGILTRPLQRLYPLEVSCAEEVGVPLKKVVEPNIQTSPVPTTSVTPDKTSRFGRKLKKTVRFLD